MALFGPRLVLCASHGIGKQSLTTAWELLFTFHSDSLWTQMIAMFYRGETRTSISSFPPRNMHVESKKIITTCCTSVYNSGRHGDSFHSPLACIPVDRCPNYLIRSVHRLSWVPHTDIYALSGASSCIALRFKNFEIHC
jgi:hypothetical protein